MPDRVGQQFGSYRLIRLLGRGGFAEVYLGQHVRLSSQKAALKILSAQLQAEDIQAFEREAETIASLIHPHIVRVLDFDIHEGLPFLVMDYAPNGSLRQRHRPGEQVPLPVVLSYLQQVSEGLQYAHDQKIIHRDIKPDNMLIGARGEIVLSDFGIATIAHSTTSQSAQTAIGTIPYMAPEQMQEYPRPASDQYALAITLYEWLVGTRPFSGTFTEIAVKHAMVPPPPLRQQRPDLPLEGEQVVLTALAKDPKARFDSVQAFARAVEEAWRPPSFPGASVPQAERAMPTLLAPTLLAPTQLAIPFEPVLAPSVPSYGPHARVITINSQRSGSINCIAWSPDSQRLVSGSDNGLIQVRNAANGHPLLEYSGHAAVNGTINSVAWSPNGRCIASASDDQTLQVWRAADGQYLFTCRRHKARVWRVAWSPDGQWLASTSGDRIVQVWQARDGRRMFQYTGHAGSTYGVAWSPDGQWLASASDDRTVQVWQATTGQIALRCDHPSPVDDVTWSPDGQWLASASDDGIIHLWNATNGVHALTFQGHGPIKGLAWSPDSQRLASASDDKTVQVWQATTGKHTFTYQAHQSAVNSVAWSLDGTSIASASSDGMMHIWQVR